MSLWTLNATPIHEHGIVHHVEFHHMKKNPDGSFVIEEDGLDDDGKPKYKTVLDHVEKLFNDGKPVELIIAGPDSNRVSMAQLSAFEVERRAKFEERETTPQEDRDVTIGRWCSAVIGWHNLPQAWVLGYDPNDPESIASADNPIEYDDKGKNARLMFSQTAMTWLGQQVDKVLWERNRFLPQGSATSESTPKPSPKPQSASRPRSRPA